MSFSNDERWYDTPISDLEISLNLFNICRRNGLTSVGDCVDALEQIISGYNMKSVDNDFTPEIIEEIKEKLISKGYWKAK